MYNSKHVYESAHEMVEAKQVGQNRTIWSDVVFVYSKG